jgi:PAS domain S-box-containing protein
MSTDPLRGDVVVSVFEAGAESFEPQTTAAIAETLDEPRERVADVLATLAERGEVESKSVGETQIWWLAQPSERRTATGDLQPEQRRRLDLFENIQDVANVGAWEYDIETDEGWGTDEVLRIHGVDSDAHVSPAESIEFYHPDDRPVIREAFERAVEDREPYDLELRLIGADGIHRWVRTRGQPQFEDGEAVRVHGTIQDITDRKDREQERQRKEAFLSNIQEIAHIGGWEVSLGSETLQWTEELYHIHGVGPDYEPTIEEAIAFYHPDDRETVRDSWDRLLSDGEQFDLELRIVRADGEVRWVRTMGDTWLDESGEMVGARGVFQDITDRKQRDQELETERRFIQQALDALDDIFYVLDTDGTLRRWNEQAHEALAYTESDFADANAVDFFPEDEHETVLDGIETVLLDGDATIEADLLTADGERRPYEYRGTRLTDRDGNTTGIVGIGRDVTARLERERRFRALVEGSNDIISVVDTEGVYRYQSPSVERILGYDPEERVGHAVVEYIHPDDRETVSDRFEKWQTDSSVDGTITYRIRHADGSWRWMEARGNQQLDNPAVEGYVINSRDVTERKRRDRELRLRSRVLEEAPVGISITDHSQADNPLVYVNQQFVDLTGYSREEATGRNCRFLQGEATEPGPVAEIRQGIDDDSAVSVELRNYRNDGTEFWNHLDVAPVEDESGVVGNYVGFQRDVTARKERERALEKRERILRELHTATREFYPPASETEIAEFLVEFVETGFEFEYVSVKQFDEQAGVLQPTARSSAVDGRRVVGPVEPGTNPIWEVYRHGTSRLFDGDTLTEFDSLDTLTNQMLVVPIGDFGVLVTFTTGDSEFDDVDTDLIEVVATNAESAFQRLRSDSVRTELVDELSTQQTRVTELRSVIAAIQSIQRRLAGSESRDALEAGVCEELCETDPVDFVWVGRPLSDDTNLKPTAWAGDGSAYLDSVETGTADELVPAQRAAAGRSAYCHNNISSLVVEECWAKEALSAGFQSVVSVPLVYDDVLYGVLTAHSQENDAFNQMYEHLFADVASLLVNYSRLLEHRFDASPQEFTELEFELSDPTYPLQRLAGNTESKIRFDTVAENMTDEIRVIGTVLDGSPEQVCAAVSSVTSILDAQLFGDNDQISLTIQKPFLASVVGKHRGKLIHAVSDESETRFQVHLPKTTSKRPLLDSLSSRYREIEPVAHRQIDTSRLSGMQQVASILTDRQYEILNAAYHGGYYETPRQVTGEDLAESFDISSPAIYNHLQSAHRKLLETVMRTASDISNEREGLDS